MQPELVGGWTNILLDIESKLKLARTIYHNWVGVKNNDNSRPWEEG